MVVGNLVLSEPVRYLILVTFLDVTGQGPELAVIAVKGRAASFITALVLVGVSRARGGEPLEDQQPCESQCPLEAPFENSRINPRAVKFGPVYLKASVTVL